MISAQRGSWGTRPDTQPLRVGDARHTYGGAAPVFSVTAGNDHRRNYAGLCRVPRRDDINTPYTTPRTAAVPLIVGLHTSSVSDASAQPRHAPNQPHST